MTPSQLESFFSKNSKNFIYEVVVNENRSTFLRLVEKKRNKIRLSLHRFFLKAPENVLKAIQKYVEEKCDLSAKEVRRFALKSLNEIDLSAYVNPNTLCPVGKFYNLQKILKKLNERYFKESPLDVHITWVPSPCYKKKRSFTFGSYDHTLRLIRVNSLLDSPFCPEYFVEYIIYHEMLHQKFPIELDASGRRQVHSLLFKKLEEEFEDFTRAKQWEKSFVNEFLTKKAL